MTAWRVRLLFEHAWDENRMACSCGFGDNGQWSFTQMQWAEHVDSILPWQQSTPRHNPGLPPGVGSETVEVPSVGDTCCGKCPGGTCYVDQVTGA